MLWGWAKEEGQGWRDAQCLRECRSWGLKLREGRDLRCEIGVLNWDAGLKAAEIWKQVRGWMSEGFT